MVLEEFLLQAVLGGGSRKVFGVLPELAGLRDCCLITADSALGRTQGWEGLVQVTVGGTRNLFYCFLHYYQFLQIGKFLSNCRMRL